MKQPTIAGRYDGITALRAIAALAVLAQHWLYYTSLVVKVPAESLIKAPFGALGVELFFVISGFVITTTRRSGPVEYAVRRFIRIYPPYWVACLLAMLMLNASGAHVVNGLRQLLLLPFGPGNWAIGVPYWTLLYEVFFYVVAGLLFLAKPSDKTVALFALSWIGALLCLHGYFPQTLVIGWPILLSPPGLCLAVGTLLCIANDELRKLNGTLLAVLAVASLALATQFAWPTKLAETAAHTVAIALVVHLATRLRTVPGWALFLGNASYGLYLVHVPILGAVGNELQRHPGLVTGAWVFAAMLFPALVCGVAYGTLEHWCHGRLLRRVKDVLRRRPVLAEGPAVGEVA